STTTLWDLYTRKQIGSEFPTYIPSFSPDGRLLAIGTETTSTTTIWDLTNSNQPAQLTNNHAMPATNIVFSSDGKTLASLASDGIVLRNLDDNTSLHLETGEYTGQFTNQMSFYADDKRFVALADDDTLVTWDASTGELTIPDAQPLKGSDTGLSTFSPGGKYLVYESDNHLSIWDVMESKPSTDTVEIPQNRNSAGGITFSQDGTVLAHSDGETITLYDFPGLSQIGKLSGGLKGIINVGLIMDTNGVRYLITLDESGDTQIWDWVTRTKIGNPMAGNLQFVGSITQNGGVVYIDSTGRLIKFDWGLDHVTWQR